MKDLDHFLMGRTLQHRYCIGIWSWGLPSFRDCKLKIFLLLKGWLNRLKAVVFLNLVYVADYHSITSQVIRERDDDDYLTDASRL
mmetsp:Transcript_15944/g.23860  ORF Transcript_15944/g.23860 Transcript_15944/m.23860 type:complete len:85 (-) Transcript_15944:35-289(-)